MFRSDLSLEANRLLARSSRMFNALAAARTLVKTLELEASAASAEFTTQCDRDRAAAGPGGGVDG